jgi:hypothetical protein
MKKTKTLILASMWLICLVLLIAVTGCDKNETNDHETTKNTGTEQTDTLPELWRSAIYTENQTFGSGSTTITVEVRAGEKSIDITIKTNKTILADALLENNLVEGENGAYGLYIKAVNGIKADYDTDHAYWALYKNGAYATSGADTTTIADGEHYELVYTKG